MNIFNILNQGQNIPIVYKCDLFSFPCVSTEQYIYMDIIAGQNGEFINIFPYIGEKESDKFIDIYVYVDNEIKRFIILPGYKLNEKDEEHFIHLIRNSYSKYHVNSELLKNIKTLYPDYNIGKLIQKDEYNVLFEMLYFTSYKSGIKEIVYKAELPHIAYDIDNYEYINLIGSTPESILDMPIKCLRYFETTEMSRCIRNASDRRIKRESYKTFSNRINKYNNISEFQWKYLEDLTKQFIWKRYFFTLQIVSEFLTKRIVFNITIIIIFCYRTHNAK
ncbi:MAG: hypothetical protein K6G88_05895 [Lachnospiraceae bacterium]|nr:hypothetical protein [Lachnospiraceae bacterium]